MRVATARTLPRRRHMKSCFKKAIRGWPIIAACSLLGLYAGVAGMRIIPPTYTSTVSILIDPKRPGSYGADAEFANIFVDSSKVDSVEVLLLSSGVLQRVVRAENLADRPEFGDAIPSLLERILPSMAARRGEPSTETHAMREARAMDKLRRMIKTSRMGMTYVIKVDVRADTAAEAQRIATDVADAYLADQIETKIDAAQRDSEWLTNQIKEQRAELIRSGAAVEGIRKKLGITGSDTAPTRRSTASRSTK